MFGWAFFSDDFAEGDPRYKYNPFRLISDGGNNNYMRLNTVYWPEADDGVGVEINDNGNPSWGQKATTGYLSSMGMDGSGFFTKGGANQYFETRMFFGPNPAHWPAFWLLTANGGYHSQPDKQGDTPWGAPVFGGPSDELDILEAYLGNPEGYQVAYHEWGYSTGKGGGKWVNLNQEVFSNINIAEGFHILGLLITENKTYYYCDNILVFEHETLKYSWELGNYFIINGGLSDHFGLPKAGDDNFGPEHQPFGFTRYGNECYDYVDWIRVWEDEPGAARTETQKPVGNFASTRKSGTEVTVSRDTFPLKGKNGETSGAWENIEPGAYEESYFTFGGGKKIPLKIIIPAAIAGLGAVIGIIAAAKKIWQWHKNLY